MALMLPNMHIGYGLIKTKTQQEVIFINALIVKPMTLVMFINLLLMKLTDFIQCFQMMNFKLIKNTKAVEFSTAFFYAL